MASPMTTTATDGLASFTVDDLITLTMRLARILAQEADLLQEMKVKDIEPLQDEKLRLTMGLERVRMQLQRDPSMLHHASSQQLEDLRAVSEAFDAVLRENHRRLLVARAVNHDIVNAIRDVVTEYNTSNLYSAEGNPDTISSRPMSVTLNKTV